MALAEDRGGDLEGLAGHGLDGPAAAVHERAEVQDGDTTDHGITWGVDGIGGEPAELGELRELGDLGELRVLLFLSAPPEVGWVRA
ncbi:hypothetical protein GCM10009544_44310 [Streptomyces stramineus]|uniref:Uncharacterized protein n=1 Tax=Streptomyces stramineus TaxID=173861 RepID=A0ABP3KDY5_9ACTN